MSNWTNEQLVEMIEFFAISLDPNAPAMLEACEFELLHREERENAMIS